MPIVCAYLRLNTYFDTRLYNRTSSQINGIEFSKPQKRLGGIDTAIVIASLRLGIASLQKGANLNNLVGLRGNCMDHCLSAYQLIVKMDPPT